MSRRLRRTAICLTLALVAALVCSTPTDASPRPVASGTAGVMRWVWPVPPAGGIVRPYEAPPGPYAAGHRGVDVGTLTGAPLVSPAAGVVAFAGVVVDRPVVTVKVGDHVLVSLEPVDATVPVGAYVARGAPLGTVGRGGHCDARCVHLGVRVDGEYVSPLLFLAGVAPAVLLPLR